MTTMTQFEPDSSVLVVGPPHLAATLARRTGAAFSPQLLDELAAVQAIVFALGPTDPFPLVRRLLAFGHRLGVVVWRPAVPVPDDRATLEPLVLTPARSGGAIRLSRQETQLVAHLAARAGRDVSREELQREVWGHRRLTTHREGHPHPGDHEEQGSAPDVDRARGLSSSVGTGRVVPAWLAMWDGAR